MKCLVKNCDGQILDFEFYYRCNLHPELNISKGVIFIRAKHETFGFDLVSKTAVGNLFGNIPYFDIQEYLLNNSLEKLLDRLNNLNSLKEFL